MKYLAILVLLLSSNLLFAQTNFHEVSAGQYMFLMGYAHGVAIADYDNDGDDDIYISTRSNTEANRLYRNNGNFSFTEVSQIAGVDLRESSRLAVWFDADNDGWLDLMVSTKVRTYFYRNQKNGTFQETSSTGLLSTSAPQSLLIGDLNGDQWLDIYTSNFQRNNELFINYGNLQFRNRISDSGAEMNNIGMGGILVDFDLDGDQDIYLVFDGNRPNALFQNDGTGLFQNVAEKYNLNAKSNGMGVDVADFNHDGLYDFYISNLFENHLLQANPDSTYTNIASTAGVNNNGMSWGIICFDYDNDRWSDAYVVNEYKFSPYSNLLYRNNGNSTFSNVAGSSPLEVNSAGYGSAASDLNSDGLLDLVVANHGDGVKILNNQSTAGNWLQLSLVGTQSNKFAVGGHVTAKIGGELIMDDVVTASGYASQNSYRLHFGAGNETEVEELTIHWPSGGTDVYTQLLVNQRYLAIEGESITVFNSTDYKDALERESLLEVISDIPNDTISTFEGQSVARMWNETLLSSIRGDFARPTVHARNLFHMSLAMYDAWAAFDIMATPVLLGKSLGNFYCPFDGISTPENIKEARREAISYAAYRIIAHRFQTSPGAGQSLSQAFKLMQVLGYDPSYMSTDYSTGSSAALGNYVASKIIEFGLQDGSNESNQYANLFYQPVNSPMRPEVAGNPNCADPNRWQQIQLVISIDQNGQPVSSTPPFLGPEWGKVVPFALEQTDLNKYQRAGNEWWVYHDPGSPPLLDPVNATGLSNEYKWNFELVSIWGSHLDPADNVMIDISPASNGNLPEALYPTTIQGLHAFYKLEEGGDISQGFSTNPKTNQPYETQLVPRGDFTRVLAEFWADGPNSETPPGHWFTILNYVSDHPDFIRKYKGEGEIMDALEWDVKAYLVLGGALHDVAVTAWGIKGYYDYTRPVFALRYMADHGQSSNPNLPNYNPAGITLKDGFIELVQAGDALAGASNEHVGKIKLYTWRGSDYIADPKTDMAGVGWILAENWWPYQRPTFVTPPFAGYISGHSTFSSAGAEVLTQLTGDEYFPGGLGEFVAKQNEYLVFEEGPSVDIKLQWARYKDASDQCSLSRIWGGIHPPVDDIPGRIIGKRIGADAFTLAEKYFNGVVSGVNGQGEGKISTSIYPNPVVDDWVNIKTSESVINLSVEFFNLTGQSILKRQFHDASSLYNIETTTIPEGLYIVKLSGRNYSTARKILIHRF